MRRVLLTFVLSFTTLHAAAWACTCILTTATDAVTSGDAVVVAVIEEVRTPGGCSGGPNRALVTVTEVIAGPGAVGALEVQTQVSDGMCGLDLAPGDTWVLQVAGDEPWVTLCTAARRVESAEDAWIVELREAAAAQ